MADNKFGFKSTSEETLKQASKQAPEFKIDTLYLKEVYFSSPITPKIFEDVASWDPNISLNMDHKHKRIKPDTYDVILDISAKVETDNKTAFTLQAQYAGIFFIKNFDPAEMSQLIESYCPSVLYNYIREIFTDLTVKGCFPPLYLQPINFDGLYQEKLKDNE